MPPIIEIIYIIIVAILYNNVTMNLRQLNNKKNLALRRFKAQLGKLALDKKNKNRFTPSKLKEISKIVFLRHDNKIGDMIISTLAFREIKKALPKAKITVIAGPSSKQIIDNNRNVDNILIYNKGFGNLFDLARQLRKEPCDLFVDMDEKPKWQNLFLLRAANPKFALGFNRESFGLYNINISFDVDNNHITARHQAAFNALKIGKIDKHYDIFVAKSLKTQAQKFLESLPKAKGNILLNPFAASRHRTLSFEQVCALAKIFADYNLIITGPLSQLQKFLGARGEDARKPQGQAAADANIFTLPPALAGAGGIYATFALMGFCALTITPDTALVHAAAAFGSKTLALYGGASEKANSNFRIWGPAGAQNITVMFYEGEISALSAQDIAQKALEILSAPNTEGQKAGL